MTDIRFQGRLQREEPGYQTLSLSIVPQRRIVQHSNCTNMPALLTQGSSTQPQDPGLPLPSATQLAVLVLLPDPAGQAE